MRQSILFGEALRVCCGISGKHDYNHHQASFSHYICVIIFLEPDTVEWIMRQQDI